MLQVLKPKQVLGLGMEKWIYLFNEEVPEEYGMYHMTCYV